MVYHILFEAWLQTLVVFGFGLGLWSFLNAVIYRLEKNESALKGRSYCPRCKHQLAWDDLIPLVSFALLGGRRRYCKGRISPQYPIVEIATALLFAALFVLQTEHVFYLLYLWVVTSLLIVLFVYDLRHYILP